VLEIVRRVGAGAGVAGDPLQLRVVIHGRGR
jgi:hypothetical protein